MRRIVEGKNNRSGFGLLEVQVALLILVLFALLGLPLLARSLQAHQSLQRRWFETLDAWNRSQEFRVGGESSGEDLPLWNQGPALERIEVESGSQLWEVLHGRP